MNRKAMWTVLGLITALGGYGEAQESAGIVERICYPPLVTLADSVGQCQNGARRGRRESFLHTVNALTEEITSLRTAGKSDGEIRAYLRSRSASSGTGSIAGTVYQGDGVTPVAEYVSVWAYNEFGRYCGYGSSFSGVYVIDDLAAGRYYVRLSSSGRYIDTYYGDVVEWEDATLVEVFDGQQTAGVNFILTQYTGAIAGTITGSGGTPLADCSVSAYDLAYNRVQSAFTDARGDYTLGGLPSGDYKLKAVCPGSENYGAEWYEDAESFDAAAVVSVSEPETTRARDFALEPGGCITGNIVGAMGEVIQPSECLVQLYDRDGGLIAQTMNDANGIFGMSKLVTGSYFLQVLYYGTFNLLDGWYRGASQRKDATPIRVVAPETTKDILVVLPRGGGISGQVSYLGHPATGFSVRVYHESGRQIETVQTDGSGNYTIDRLPTGRYKMLVLFTGYLSTVGQTPVPQWYGKAYEFSQAAFVEVRAPAITTNADVELEQGGYIACRVFDHQGLQVRSAVAVYAYPTTGDAVVSSSAHSDGRYYLQGLKTDQYQVAVLYSMNGSTTVEWYDGQPSRGTASLLGVIAPSGNRSIDVTLERPATLQGFVTDIAGNRVTSSEHGVIVYVYDAASGHSVLGNDISFAGGFQSTLMARSYKVSALNVHWSWMGQQDSLAVAYYPTGSAFSDAACMTLALQEGGVVELDQFVLPGACGGIEGTLSDGGTGAPVTSGTYFVVTVDSEGFLAGASGYSDLSAAVNGHYRLTGLRPGTYYVLALLAPLSVSYRYAQWYGNISVPISVALNATKLDPPPNALPVVVGEGMTSGVNLQFSLPTGISPGRSAELPGTYSLSQNYPNPFNPSTSIEFSLPTAGPVTLTVYNVLGEEVARLVAVDRSAGTFTTVWDATGLASGVYLYRLTAGEYVQTKKAVLIK